MAVNDYEKLDPYYNYGDPNDLSPYELLNRMKSWDKAIRLQVTALSEETQAQLDILEDQITASVTDIRQDMVTEIGILNGKIDLRVVKGTVISEINVSPEAIRIAASKVNLDGYATFTALGTNGMTVIHGGNIMTDTILASKIAANQISTSHIQTSAISSDKIQTGAVIADKIQSYAITADKIMSNAIMSYHIQAGQISAGHIVAQGLTADIIRGGILSGVTLQIDTDATVGSNLYLGGWGGSKAVIFGNGGRIDYNGSQMTLSANYLNLANSNLDINSYTTVRGTLYVPSTTNLSGVVRAESSGIGISENGSSLIVKRNGSTIGTIKFTS